MIYCKAFLYLMCILIANCIFVTGQDLMNPNEVIHDHNTDPEETIEEYNSNSPDLEADKRLLSYMAQDKRLPNYDFGLGKRGGGMGYNFGLGKRPQNMYSFGLGKRMNPMYAMGKRPKEMYAFGLGKRSADDYYDNSHEDLDQDVGVWEDDYDKRNRGQYSFGLGKRPMNYNFGLGKRPMAYNFGLGKRPMNYNFGLGKRERLYSFGLGKREASNEQYEKSDDTKDVKDDHTTDQKAENNNKDTEKHDRTKRAANGMYSFGLGKRRPYDFGLGKRPKLYSFGVGKRDYEEIDENDLYE